MAEAHAHNLQFEGYEVVVTNDGVAALKAAIDQSPDLILLDIMMPKMDGLEVCKQIRQAGHTVPILNTLYSCLLCAIY